MRQQAAGFNHLRSGILLQPELRNIIKPIDHALVEPAHTLFVHGVGNTTVFLYFETLYAAGVRDVYREIHNFLEVWTFPHGVGKAQLVETFCPERVASWRKSQHLKCDAQKFLQLLPVLAFWVGAYGLGGGVGADEAAAFMAYVDVHENAHLLRLGECSRQHLDDLVWAFLGRCEAVGWHASMHPKFHWLVHLPWGISLSALPCEAKHKVPKRYAREQCNLTGFDKSVLSNTVASTLADMGNPDCMSFEPRLLLPRAPPSRLRDLLARELGDVPCVVACTARLANRGTIAIGDVVLLFNSVGQPRVVAGEVYAICESVGVAFVLVSVWSELVLFDARTGGARWRDAPTPEWWELEHVLHACIYRRVGGDVVTLVPPQLRRYFE